MPSTANTPLGRMVDELGNVLLQPPIGGLGRVYSHGPRGQRRIALTFDDGPNEPSTSRVLDILGQHEVSATFFCVGANALQHPHLVARAVAEGHVIGNHSMHHSRKAGLAWGDGSHIDQCTAVLEDVLKVSPRLYRAPWGWLTPWETKRVLRRRLIPIGWDIYTYDWQVPGPDGEDIARQVCRDARPGSIVLFHDGIAGVKTAYKPQTVAAVDRTIKELRSKGYQFETVPKLLDIPGHVGLRTSTSTVIT